jgi:pSer/pThr/pTyr-binding forkhead associated (FHA) protein
LYEPRHTFCGVIQPVLSPDTQPRIVLGPGGDSDRPVAVAILAGYSLSPLPASHPRFVLVDSELEFGRENSPSRPGGFEDTLLSRRHARITRTASDAYLLEDLGSTNGTWLDGIRIPAGAQQTLRHGSVFLLGGQAFVFRRIPEDSLAAMREELANPFGPMPTLSPTMALLSRKLRRLAPANVDLLLTGETGVGKQIYADAVHLASGRQGPLLSLNCASIPEETVEGELFGGANGPGLLERAHGGTLFLDEIDELPPGAQSKLLRFLQNRQILAGGSGRPATVDTRVVASSNRPVAQEEVPGLRHDLAARLGPASMVIPPLRDRCEDLGPLIDYLSKDRMSFVPEAYLALFLHSWKANIREVEKVLTVAQVLANGEPHVDLEHLPTPVAARVDELVPPSRRRRRPTREELVEALARHGGDVAELARELGRQRTLVWRWLREHQLRADDFRS